MNKLDYLDMKLEGEGSISDLFKEMGSVDISEEFDSSASDDVSNVEMKATSVRLPVTLLDTYDAVLKKFGLSRQDTFSYMVHDFISKSVTSYVEGRVQYILDNQISVKGCDTTQQLIQHEYDAFIESIPASDEVKKRIYSISQVDMVQMMRDA